MRERAKEEGRKDEQRSVAGGIQRELGREERRKGRKGSKQEPGRDEMLSPLDSDSSIIIE